MDINTQDYYRMSAGGSTSVAELCESGFHYVEMTTAGDYVCRFCGKSFQLIYREVPSWPI
jgi:hypothetical protein